MSDGMPLSISDVCHIRQSPEGGLGIFSNRHLPIGQLIISEPPLIILDHRPDLPHGIDIVSLHTALRYLSPRDLSIFYSLHSAQGPPDVISIFQTNCFKLSNETLRALFPTISRINHSCSPNCNSSFNYSLGQQSVYATEEIAKGSELFISYINPYQPRSTRENLLWEGYGFECHCRGCDIPVEDIWINDERRSRINDLDLTYGRSLPENLDQGYKGIMQWIRLLSEDYLDYPELGRAHQQASSICFMSSDIPSARRHAGQAYACMKISNGEDHSDTREMYYAYLNPPIDRYQPRRVAKLPVICGECGGEGVISCGGCFGPCYCSEECRREHWEVHYPLCKVLRELSTYLIQYET